VRRRAGQHFDRGERQPFGSREYLVEAPGGRVLEGLRSPASSAFRHPSAAACNALTSSGWSFSHEIIPNSTRRFTFQTRQTEANEERKSSLIFNLSIHHTDYYFYYH
jgi:hypothetical protein